jgi:large subunit ribosomal protein L29
VPIVRIKDINNMSSADRKKKLTELRTELSRLRTMVSAGGSVENPSRIREIRKAIARILTVEREQQLGLRKKPEKETKKASKPKESKVK